VVIIINSSTGRIDFNINIWLGSVSEIIEFKIKYLDLH
jgi:hypothetical protein